MRELAGSNLTLARVSNKVGLQLGPAGIPGLHHGTLLRLQQTLAGIGSKAFRSAKQTERGGKPDAMLQIASIAAASFIMKLSRLVQVRRLHLQLSKAGACSESAEQSARGVCF